MEKEILKDINLINGRLDEINKLISPYKLAYVSPVSDCVPLQKNAHFMEKDILDKLVHNVEEDGFLSQLPFAMKQPDGKFLIMSGNHRLKASIKAGLKYILILYVEDISKEKQISYQLSHNSLVGKDDMCMLKEIYDEMHSIEAKEFSGLNDIKFIDIEKIQTNQINDGDIELTEMKFLFVESKSKETREIIEILEKQKLDENSSIVFGSFEQFIKQLTELKIHFGIKSNSVAFGRMISICKEYIEKDKHV